MQTHPKTILQLFRVVLDFEGEFHKGNLVSIHMNFLWLFEEACIEL